MPDNPPTHDDAESETERVEDWTERLFSVGGCTCTWDEDGPDGVVVKPDPDCPAHALLAELARERERAERAKSLIRRYQRPFVDGGLNPAERRQAMHQLMVEAEARAETAEHQLHEASTQLERVERERDSQSCICGKQHGEGTEMVGGVPAGPDCRPLTWRERYDRLLNSLGDRRREGREAIVRAETAEHQLHEARTEWADANAESCRLETQLKRCQEALGYHLTTLETWIRDVNEGTWPIHPDPILGAMESARDGLIRASSTQPKTVPSSSSESDT